MPLSFQHGSRRDRQSGAGLIEVLVAVVVLTFGLLGLAGLQFSGNKFNHSAYLRSQATSLAYDAADRMRSNLAAAYVTDLATQFDAANGPGCNAALGAVTPVRDINQWKSCLETALPMGRGRVSELARNTAYVDNCGRSHAAHTNATRLFVIEVTWSNDRLQNENARECVVLRTEVGLPPPPP